jgi:hypothetical protein
LGDDLARKVGLDLGTTNSAVAIPDEGAAPQLARFPGQYPIKASRLESSNWLFALMGYTIIPRRENRKQRSAGLCLKRPRVLAIQQHIGELGLTFLGTI